MRAILIDPETKNISEITLKRLIESLQEFYDLIGTNTVEIVKIDKEIDMVIDEEGRLKPIKGAFRFFGITDLWFAGKAVIIGEKNSSFVSLQENLSSFQMIVEWIIPKN